MRSIPDKVREALLRLREGSSASLEIRIIKGNFYVYKVKNIWSKAKKKQIKKGEYFGKIESDGTFKPAQRRKPRRMKIYAEEQNPPSQFRMHKSSLKYELQILKALSMNGRITMKALGKLIGLSETAARHQVEALEKKYSIKYIPEIDITKLGYMPFFITVKFIGDMPPIEALKKELESIPLIQAAFLTKGSFDLMIYAVARSNEDLLFNVLIKTRRDLSQYDSLWNIIIVYEDYGYIPLREQFVEALKEQVWHRSKQSERPKEGQLRERAFNVLKELIKDGKAEFSKIGEKYNLNEQEVRYEYLKLVDSGAIRRTTISINNLPLKYVGILQESFINYKKFRDKRASSLSDIIEDNAKAVNKYIAVFDSMNPDGSLLFVPVFEGNELYEITEKLKKLDLGIEISTAVITNMLVGSFCLRKFDNAYSVQQKILEEEYGYEKIERINYESKEKQKENYKLDIRGLPIEKIE